MDADQGRYKTLRINFAHFGGCDLHGALFEDLPTENWTRQIIGLMDDFNNVYADLSYCPDPKIVNQVKRLVDKHPIVAKRTIFGTDYIMIMMERDLGGLKNYFDYFEGLPNQMFFVNVRRFLDYKDRQNT